MQKASLKDVALCAIDSAHLPLTTRAMEISLSQCEFADAGILSDHETQGNFRYINSGGLGQKSAWDYNTFIIKNLGDYFKAPYLLTIQWDGYVINPDYWDVRFLEYDYIGPKWPWHKDGHIIGCGGFALRSRRLLDALKDPLFEIPQHYVNEDDYIGRQARPLLEKKYGIKFPPEYVADKFAYERSNPFTPSFGFHGLFNMWRHVEDQEMVRLSPLIPKSVTSKLEYLELLIVYFAQRRFGPLEALYRHLRQFESLEILKNRLASATHNPVMAEEFTRLCVTNWN